MTSVRAAVIAVLATALLALAALAALSPPEPAAPPIAELNHLTQELAESWAPGEPPEHETIARIVEQSLSGPAPEEGGSMTLPAGTEVSIVDADGTVLHATADPIASPLQAASQRALSLPITDAEGTVLGMVHATDPAASRAIADQNRRQALVAGAAVVAISAMAVLSLLRVRRRILLPFRELQGFAQDVAAGRLDVPLRMDSRNVFGAWTESFDLMRTELETAQRERERLQEETRTTLAQISHDLRTPIASILTTVEMLQLREQDPAARARIDVIERKALQVEQLLGDLFLASREQLAALPISTAVHPSSLVEHLLRVSDIYGRMRMGRIPQALVQIDARRLQQVFDNVVDNAAKYADTQLDVSFDQDAELLRVSIGDRGPGLPAQEREAVLGRGIRGGNVGSRPGEGLGLYTAAQLMERMGGGLSVDGRDGGGLTVHIDVPLG